jgi:HEAT repeat protein
VALGGLFQTEKDNDLKTEILDSLFDIDGQEDRKAALLAVGAGSDQAKDVRQSAIDGLSNLDPKVAIPILQSLAGDPDPDIRELAKDTIDQLQTQNTLQK